MNYLDLPVYKHKDLILSALAEHQVIVVESPTGSGKTTQLPVILYEAGYAQRGVIGVTQPRRIAALSVSEFIAKQMERDGAAVVGYKMRFEDKTDISTKIKIMTDGILLQEMKLDPWLSRYSCIIIDEAHERSLNIDFILGLLKRVLEERPEFKVIVSSATINADVFSEYFGECPVVKIDAISYPVQVVYEPLPQPSLEKNERSVRGRRERGGGSDMSDILLDKITNIVSRTINEGRGGDILIFLSGEKIIKDCMQRLYSAPFAKKIHIVPLYGRLGKEEQERVFNTPPAGKTKIVISTNIAETSVTIDGITTVIDSGLSKLNYYNPATYSSSLIEGSVSKASANQRKGRAGRTRPGVCYRLYDHKDFDRRPLFTTEEIFRTDLSEVILRMSDLGITEFEDFDFIAAPERDGIAAAIETLNLLNALESDRTLSKTGKMMTEFPLLPRQSRIIVEAILKYPQVVEETVIAAAFLSTQSPYILPPGEEFEARQAHHRFRDPNGDFVSYLKLYREYMKSDTTLKKEKFCDKNYLDPRSMAEIANIVEQLGEIVGDIGVPITGGGSVEDYLCCVARGMIQFVCTRDDWETYSSLTEDGIIIHPGSVMFKTEPKYIVAGEIVRTSRMYAMSVSPLSPRTLARVSEDLFMRLGGNLGRLKKKKALTTQSGKKTDIFEIIEKSNGGIEGAIGVKIAGKFFEIKQVKKRKTVILPWEQFAAVKDSLKSLNLKEFKKVRAQIVLKDDWIVCAGERFDRVLAIAPLLDLDDEAFEAALKRSVPQESFNTQENLMEMLEYFPRLGLLCPMGKNKKKLGFFTLDTASGIATDTESLPSVYFFLCEKSFTHSTTRSIAAIEILIDELDEGTDIGVKAVINETYRRLSGGEE